MPGVLGNVCGDWLNLWVNLGKKDMLPKVLSFSLFWEDSEDGTVSSLKCFLPSNFFYIVQISPTGFIYWVYYVHFFPICSYVSYINQNKPNQQPSLHLSAEVSSILQQCLAIQGFFEKMEVLRDTQLSVEQAVWGRDWHSWVALCIIPYHVAERVQSCKPSFK